MQSWLFSPYDFKIYKTVPVNLTLDCKPELLAASYNFYIWYFCMYGLIGIVFCCLTNINSVNFFSVNKIVLDTKGICFSFLLHKSLTYTQLQEFSDVNKPRVVSRKTL